MAGGTSTSDVGRQLVDVIVREVLARLAAREPATPTMPSDKELPTTLVVDDRVVSVRTLQGRLATVRQVVLARGAVLTPAARDLLKDKNVTLSYAVRPIAKAARHNVTLATADTDCEPADLVAGLTAAGAGVERLARTGLVSVSEELCDAVATGGRLGILLTAQAAAAVCLCNRRRGVRAAAPDDAVQLASALAGIGCNLLVVDPTGRTFFELKRLCGQFVRAGERRCPAALAGPLG